MKQEKLCTHCNIMKPLSEYYSKGDRYDARCKVCVKEAKKKKRKSIKKKKEFNERNRKSSRTLNITNYEVLDTGDFPEKGIELVVDFLLKEKV